jgi:hypothetical protein
MRRAMLVLALLTATRPLFSMAWQGSSLQGPDRPSDSTPLYRISFERGNAVAGVNSTGAVRLPFQCTSDGTIFVTFAGGVPANSGLRPPLRPPLEFVSIAPPDHAQVFRLDQVPDLFDSREIDHYPSESEVVFLVWASRENKPEKRAISSENAGGKREYTVNAAAHHRYIVTFSREGEYKRTVEIDDAFSIQHVGVFPSGTLLAFGFDKSDHSPKLAMLKEDGTLLKFLEIPKGDAPVSMVGGNDSPQRGVIAQSELVPEGRSILIVQNKTTFPVLEVGEGGAIRAIYPKLLKGEQIEAAIPSDRGLYVIVSPETKERGFAGVTYEVNPEDGSLMKRFELTSDHRPSDVACVHEGKFLSLDYGDSEVVPLIGSAEPANAVQQKSGH